MKRNVLARRAASAALAACMMFSLSAPALAASTDALLQQSTAAKSAVSVLDEENGMMEEEPAYQMNLKYGSIRVYIGADDKQYVQQGNNEAQQRGNLSITTDGGRTTNTLTIEGGTTAAKVTLHNVNIDASGAAVSVSGDVELIISGTNTLQSGWGHAGVEKADDNGTLTISGSGTLNAYGGESGAGIGSGSQKGCSNIEIESGIINAHGGQWGAGIGSGNVGNRPGVLGGSYITINGGDVTAYGGSEAAGIGGGFKGNGKDITINGGTVHAESGGGNGPVAAIGGGRVDGKGENIQITGGNVTLKTVDDDDIYIGNGQQEAEIDPSKLFGTITKLDKDGNQVDEIVQYFNIKINNTPVTRKNYKDILGICYDIKEKTLKLKDGKPFDGNLTIDAPADVSIDLEANASHVVNGNLTVTGAKDVKVTKLKGDDAAEEAIVAINGKAEISCSGDVILKNLGGSSYRGRNLTRDGLTVNGANNVTTEGSIGGETMIDCTGDIELGNKWGTTVSKLTVNSANDVKVTSGSVNWSIENGANITCSGTVEIKGETPIKGDVTIDAGKDVSLEYEEDEAYEDNQNVINITAAGKVKLNRNGTRNLGKVIFAQKKGQPYVYFTDKSSEEYKDYRITPIPKTIESKYLRIEPRETYNITVKNGTAQVGDDTTGLTSAFEGETVTVSGNNKNPSVTKFGGWKVVSPESFELTEAQKNTEENMTFTMPASPVELKASYSFPAPILDMQVTVKDGTIRVGKGERQTGTVFVQPGQTVTIEADEPAKENESFHHWKVEKDSSKNIGIIEGSLGSETEKGTEKIVFTMPQDGVKLTAVYSIPASVLRSTVTVTGGTAKSTLDEGSDIPAEIGTTVEITATPYDAEKYPGMEFVEWEIKYPDSFYQNFPDGIPENLQLKLDNAKSATTTFEMPVYPVKLIAHWSASPVAKPDPDEPIDEDFGVEPAPMDTTGGTIAAVAVGGAAIWGGYEIATRVILNDLLPAGAAIPANRGQLALLMWNTAGRPEPAAQPAFADITDAEQAKAAQWCVEQGTMDAKGDRFEPEGWTPKFKVIEVWNKAFPKQ